MEKKVWILILIFIIVFFIYSCDRLQQIEEGFITFNVKDKVTNTPIQSATIKIIQNGSLVVQAKTDENGSYEFKLPTGDYDYEVSKTYYYPLSSKVTVYTKEKRTENVLLEPAENNPPTFGRYISPLDNQIVKDKKVTFKWEANDIEEDAIYYNIYLKYLGNDFIKLNDDPLETNNYTYEPPIKGKYQWRVELWDEPNKNYKILIREAPQFDYQPTLDSTFNHKPEISLVYPADNDPIATSKINFSWVASDADKDPLTFDLFLGKSETTFNNIISNYKKTSYTYSLNSTGQYFWKVLVSDGKETVESSVFSFNYSPPENATPIIQLFSPEDNSSFISNEIVFSWMATDTDNGTLLYSLNIGKSETTLNEIISFEDLQNKKISYTYKLQEPGDFYWNVEVSDTVNPPVKSKLRKFTISSQNKPPIIDSYHKPDAPTVVGTTVSFEWKAFDPEGTPLSFDFYISDVYDDVNNLIENDYTEYNLQTNRLDKELNYSSTYYWRIVATDGMYIVPGPIWSFEFVKKEEGELPDIYFIPNEINIDIDSVDNFTINTSFKNNIHGFDIRISYDPEYIDINPENCIENTLFDDDNYYVIKKIIEYNDHNEFIFSVVSEDTNFVLPENLITVEINSKKSGNTKIKFEKSTYMYEINDTEILFTTGDFISITIGQ
ncbi:hypothetical protein X275_04860 [Marinitoga sp. 1197]|uniref:carboxypeptidase-like regulatory domain-containing protein n=1 Tax=Marinitoga sp. 1197 TaxID=1428449 RepID=UPI0006416CBE|nr:carboxypeptidase regulatory-like domain-containing protein [Marinitoga sp. 1197]KLO22860.1 hypothetical protein X275_04860 [Marinitoga sp. 1197]